MRQISVSTDVYAAIWSLRQVGEESEDEILARVLLGARDSAPPISFGFTDPRYGVSFPEGFSVFRLSRGKKIEAVASGGSWWISGVSTPARSLNELSRLAGAGTENAWLRWHYMSEDGTKRSIASLRKTGVQERQLEKRNAKGLMIGRWRPDVVEALTDLGGRGSLAEIYGAVRKVRDRNGHSRPSSLEAIVRRTLEENCSGTASYKGRDDLFEMPKGRGAGYWSLKS